MVVTIISTAVLLEEVLTEISIHIAKVSCEETNLSLTIRDVDHHSLSHRFKLEDKI